MIKDDDSTALADRNDVLGMWKDYVGDFYSDNARRNTELEDVDTGSSILRTMWN